MDTVSTENVISNGSVAGMELLGSVVRERLELAHYERCSVEASGALRLYLHLRLSGMEPDVETERLFLAAVPRGLLTVDGVTTACRDLKGALEIARGFLLSRRRDAEKDAGSPETIVAA